MLPHLMQILNVQRINSDSLNSLLCQLGLKSSIKDTDSEILLYKQLEGILLNYYKEELEINLSNKFWSKEEVLGLLAFLWVRKTKQTDTLIENYFNAIFFTNTHENESIKEENKALIEENKALKEENRLLKEIDLFRTGGDVDYEILKRLEGENVKLKEIIQYEHGVIVEAWYNLCEEYLKGGDEP